MAIGAVRTMATVIVGGGDVHQHGDQNNAKLSAFASMEIFPDKGNDRLKAPVVFDQCGQCRRQYGNGNGLIHTADTASHGEKDVVDVHGAGAKTDCRAEDQPEAEDDKHIDTCQSSDQDHKVRQRTDDVEGVFSHSTPVFRSMR